MVAPTSASGRFGNFIGDVVRNGGNVLGLGTRYLTKQFEQSQNPTVQKIYTFFNERQTQFAYFSYALGGLYNFATSPFLFTVGVGIGFIASAVSIGFPSLENGEVCGLTAKDGFAGQNAMAILGIANRYLGTNFWEDAFFGGTAGLLVGNTLFHQFRNTQAVHTAVRLTERAGGVLQALPLIHLLFPLNTRETVPTETQAQPTVG